MHRAIRILTESTDADPSQLAMRRPVLDAQLANGRVKAKALHVGGDFAEVRAQPRRDQSQRGVVHVIHLLGK